MTPEQLAQYLDVMAQRGVMDGQVSFTRAEYGGQVTISVRFAPDAMPLPGEAPTPGGWKSPTRLDAPDAFDREEP